MKTQYTLDTVYHKGSPVEFGKFPDGSLALLVGGSVANIPVDTESIATEILAERVAKERAESAFEHNYLVIKDYSEHMGVPQALYQLGIVDKIVIGIAIGHGLGKVCRLSATLAASIRHEYTALKTF